MIRRIYHKQYNWLTCTHRGPRCKMTFRAAKTTSWNLRTRDEIATTLSLLLTITHTHTHTHALIRPTTTISSCLKCLFIVSNHPAVQIIISSLATVSGLSTWLSVYLYVICGVGERERCWYACWKLQSEGVLMSNPLWGQMCLSMSVWVGPGECCRSEKCH